MAGTALVDEHDVTPNACLGQAVNDVGNEIRRDLSRPACEEDDRIGVCAWPVCGHNDNAQRDGAPTPGTAILEHSSSSATCRSVEAGNRAGHQRNPIRRFCCRSRPDRSARVRQQHGQHRDAHARKFKQVARGYPQVLFPSLVLTLCDCCSGDQIVSTTWPAGLVANTPRCFRQVRCEEARRLSTYHGSPLASWFCLRVQFLQLREYALLVEL